MREAAVERVREAMQANDIERLAVTDSGNLTYLTGIEDPSGMSGLLMLEQDDWTLLVSKFYRYSVKDIHNARIYASREERKAALDDLEIGDAVADDPSRFEDAEPDGTDIITECRSTKLPVEIEAMREACARGSQVFAEVLKRVETGMQEWGLVREADAAFRDQHAYNAFPTIAHINTEEPHRPPSARMVDDGDLVLMDLGCRVEGYCSDMTRMVPNQVSGERKKVLDAVATLQQEALDRVEAGVSIPDLAGAVTDRVAELGFDVEDHYLHSLGHGVGVDIHEGPVLSREADGELEENMVVTIEPGLYVPGVGGARIEDQIVVREDGYERLTGAPRIYDR